MKSVGVLAGTLALAVGGGIGLGGGLAPLSLAGGVHVLRGVRTTSRRARRKHPCGRRRR